MSIYNRGAILGKEEVFEEGMVIYKTISYNLIREL